MSQILYFTEMVRNIYSYRYFDYVYKIILGNTVRKRNEFKICKAPL